MKKELELKLEGYSTSQINQILKGIDEEIPFILSINTNCAPSQIRLYRTFMKENLKDLLISVDEIKYLSEHFDQINDISCFPVNCPKGWTVSFFEIAKTNGFKKTADLFNSIDTVPTLQMLSYIKKYFSSKDFSKSVLSFTENKFYDYMESIDTDKGNIILKKINEAENITRENLVDIMNFSKRIDEYLDESTSLYEFKKILDKTSIEDLHIYNNFLSYHPDFNEFLKLLEEYKPSFFNILKTISPIPFDIIEKYKDLFDKHEKFFSASLGSDVFNFLSTFKPGKAIVKDLSALLEAPTFADLDNLKTVTHAFGDIKYYTNKKISKNAYLEKTSFIFKKDFNFEQKTELLRNLQKQMPDKCIVDYVNPEFSAEQIAVLRRELIFGKDIKNALNPSFTVDHMKHIIYYNTKGIIFENDADYDKNYVKDRNADYKNFLNFYDEIIDNSYNAEERIRDVTTLSRINAAYDLNLNIEEFSQHYVNYELIDEILKYCKKNNVNPQKVLNENSTYESIRDYKKILEDER